MASMEKSPAMQMRLAKFREKIQANCPASFPVKNPLAADMLNFHQSLHPRREYWAFHRRPRCHRHRVNHPCRRRRPRQHLPRRLRLVRLENRRSTSLPAIR